MYVASPFTAVSSDDYFYDALTWAYEQGIAKGNSTAANTFGPKGTCRRDMMITFLYRPFTDATA